MRTITKVFTDTVSTTMLAQYTTFVSNNKVSVQTICYYKDGLNHYLVIGYVFTN